MFRLQYFGFSKAGWATEAVLQTTTDLCNLVIKNMQSTFYTVSKAENTYKYFFIFGLATFMAPLFLVKEQGKNILFVEKPLFILFSAKLCLNG